MRVTTDPQVTALYFASGELQTKVQRLERAIDGLTGPSSVSN